MSKLGFTVIQTSGEDVEYPASELNTHSPHTKGWQSPRFCEFPQELGLQLAHRSQLTQLQLLSHQHKIATKIELFVGDGDSYASAEWARLGYLSLDSNERSKYQARELKSVYLDCKGRYLKLLVHRCYINRHNLFNQVGVIAINALGEYSGAGGGRDKLPHIARGVGGGAGAGGEVAAPGGAGGDGAQHDLAFDMNLGREDAMRIRQIISAKEEAVAREDYDAAKRLKRAEDTLRQFGGRLAQLEVAKHQAVERQDFDRAKLIKQEVEYLMREIEAHRMAGLAAGQ